MNAEPCDGGRRRAYLLLTVTAVCWGANAVFGRLAVDQVSPLAMVSLRWLGVLLLLAVFAPGPVRRDWAQLRPRLGFVALMGVCGFTLFNSIYYTAAHSTTALNIGILQGSVPMFVLIGALLIYRTPVGRLQLAGVLLTLSGVMTVAAGGEWSRLTALTLNPGDVLMIVACLFYAGYAVALRQRPPGSAMGLFTVMAAAAFISSLPLSLAEYLLGNFQWPTAQGWLVIGLAVLLPSFVAQVFFIQGVAIIGPERAGVFVNLVPVFASLLAVLLLQESFERFHALALLLVLGGIYLSERFGPGR